MSPDIKGVATTRRSPRGKRTYCADCSKVISQGNEMVVQDGATYHLFCAGFVHAEKVAPCPECFLIPPCNCVGV